MFTGSRPARRLVVVGAVVALVAVLSACGGGGDDAAGPPVAGRLVPRPSAGEERGGPLSRTDCDVGVELARAMVERAALEVEPTGEARRRELDLEIAERRRDVPEPLLGTLEEAAAIMRRTMVEVQELGDAMARGERPYSRDELVMTALRMEERMRAARLDARFDELCPRAG